MWSKYGRDIIADAVAELRDPSALPEWPNLDDATRAAVRELWHERRRESGSAVDRPLTGTKTGTPKGCP